MSQFIESNDSIETHAALAREALEGAQRAADETAEGMEQDYSTAVEKVRDLHLKLIDMAEANAAAAFELTRRIVMATGPSDIIASCGEHGRKQFELLTAQAAELVVLGQKVASAGAAPMMRMAQQPFAKGT